MLKNTTIQYSSSNSFKSIHNNFKLNTIHISNYFVRGLIIIL